MNKFLQQRKLSYVEEMINHIGKANKTIVALDKTFTCHIGSMIGSVYFKCEELDLFIYCTPACDQILSDKPFAEDHNRVDIEFSIVGAGDSSDFHHPILLCWHDVESDVETYFAVVRSIIARELVRSEMTVAA